MEKENGGGEGRRGKYLEKENIFFCGGAEKRRMKYLSKENTFKRRSRKTEKEKEENNMEKEKLLRTDIKGSIRGP